MISVPADGEAILGAGRPMVKKNMSVPHTTAVPRMPTRDTGHIQWFIVPPGVGTRRRTVPSTIHDSHHRVDRTLAKFLFLLTVDKNGQKHFSQMA